MYEGSWKLLTANEAAPLLGFRTAKALRLAAQQGFIPRVVRGRCVLFDLDTLKEWARKGGTPLKGEDEKEAQKSEQSLPATI